MNSLPNYNKNKSNQRKIKEPGINRKKERHNCPIRNPYSRPHFFIGKILNLNK